MAIVILSLFSGINLAFALTSFFIVSKNKKQSIYLYFGIFSLFAGLYFLLIVLAETLNVNLYHLIIVCAGVYYGIFPWFVAEFVNKKKKSFLWFQSSIFILAVILFFIDQDGNKFALWQIVAHIGLLFLLATAAYGSVLLIREKKASAIVFTMLSVLFGLLAIEEIITNYSRIQSLSIFTVGILPLDIYPVLFTIVMGRLLSDEIWTKTNLKIKLMKSDLIQKKLEIKELEKKQLEDKLALKSKDLTDFAVEIARKNEFVQNSLNKLLEIEKSSEGESSKLEELIVYVKSQNRINKDLSIFQKNADKINHEFITGLKNAYPTLTDNEVHLASLLRLKLSSKEIASIKNITPDSVKVLRYRLRKKLNVPSNQGLSDFLVSI